jgi:hypothetical protein
VSTIEFEEDQIRRDIWDQQQLDDQGKDEDVDF